MPLPDFYFPTFESDRLIKGNKEDNYLSGSNFLFSDDTIIGGRGDDTLVGGRGDDILRGNQGDDVLQGQGNYFSGLFSNVLGFNGNDIDTLTGGRGKDEFILGRIDSLFTATPFNTEDLIYSALTARFADYINLFQSEEVFYDNAGADDYALITDFNPNEDIIRLAGEAKDYNLGSSSQGLPQGTAIYLGAASENEVVAILQDSFISDFSSGFNFLNDSVTSANLS